MSTITEHDKLSSALFGKTRRAVLALFFSHPDESFYLREIERVTGTAHGAVQRELKRLSDAGIITRSARGRIVYYRANRQSALFDELHGLVLKTAGLADVLRAALAPLADTIDIAFVYGSMARGTVAADSDVDLMVVGDVDEMALHKAIEKAEKQLARPVNYTLLSHGEFKRRRAEKAGFLARVLAGPKIGIIGAFKDV